MTMGAAATGSVLFLGGRAGAGHTGIFKRPASERMHTTAASTPLPAKPSAESYWVLTAADVLICHCKCWHGTAKYTVIALWLFAL